MRAHSSSRVLQTDLKSVLLDGLGSVMYCRPRSVTFKSLGLEKRGKGMRSASSFLVSVIDL